jgi:hypothetical protein
LEPVPLEPVLLAPLLLAPPAPDFDVRLAALLPDSPPLAALLFGRLAALVEARFPDAAALAGEACLDRDADPERLVVFEPEDPPLRDEPLRDDADFELLDLPLPDEEALVGELVEPDFAELDLPEPDFAEPDFAELDFAEPDFALPEPPLREPARPGPLLERFDAPLDPFDRDDPPALEAGD